MSFLNYILAIFFILCYTFLKFGLGGDLVMYKVSDFNKEFYKPSEIAKMLGVSAQTIRNRVDSGSMKCNVTEGGHRVISRNDLLDFLRKDGLIYEDGVSLKYDVIYARVSSHEQKEKGDLDRQVSYIVENVSGLNNLLVLKEVGSGLNDKRRQLLKLIELVMEGKVNRIYLTYKDRLTRFGYNYLKTIFSLKNVEIVVLNDIKEDKSVQMELVEDMMSLIASFSGKLYGMRSHNK